MAESDVDLTDPRQVASVTLAYLRRIENQLTKTLEVLERHDAASDQRRLDTVVPST
jgi:hypothetical protein